MVRVSEWWRRSGVVSCGGGGVVWWSCGGGGGGGGVVEVRLWCGGAVVLISPEGFGFFFYF